MNRELICIVCPKGCHIQVIGNDESPVCHGHACPRGEAYALQEIRSPKRMLTTTVTIRNALHPRCPVISSQPIPKEKMMEMLKILSKIEVEAPVKLDQVIVENILNTGIDILASRTLEKI